MKAASFGQRLNQRAADAGISLSPLELMRLDEYYSLLRRWNQKVNLTALSLDGFPDETLDRLLIEPLLAARVVPSSPLRWLDLGSGGGSPAIPLKILRPLANLTMVEARSKKAAFLREAVHMLELADANVETVRFEELPPSCSADLVTVRAVRVDAVLGKASAALLKPGGRLVLFGALDAVPSSIPGFLSEEAVHLAPTSSALYLFTKLG